MGWGGVREHRRPWIGATHTCLQPTRARAPMGHTVWKASWDTLCGSVELRIRTNSTICIWKERHLPSRLALSPDAANMEASGATLHPPSGQ